MTEEKPTIRLIYRSCAQFSRDRAHIVDGIHEAGYEVFATTYPAGTDPKWIARDLGRIIDPSKGEVFITDRTVGSLLAPLVKDGPSRIPGARPYGDSFDLVGPLDSAYYLAIPEVLGESGISRPDDTEELGPFKESLSFLVRKMIKSKMPSHVFIDKRKITHHSPFYDIGASKGYTDLRTPISPEPMQIIAYDAIKEGLIAGGIPEEIIAEETSDRSWDAMIEPTRDAWVIQDRHLSPPGERHGICLRLPLSTFYQTAIDHDLLKASPDALREKVIEKLLETIEGSE